MDPPAQAWQTLHICSTTSLSYCGERGISSRADTSSPWASASCLRTSIYCLPFKNSNATGKPDSPFYHFSAIFFSFSVRSQQPAKTSRCEYAICSPTNLLLHPDGLGQALSWKLTRCSGGLKQPFYINTNIQWDKTKKRVIPCCYHVTSKRLNTVMWPLVSFLKNEIHLGWATELNIWVGQDADVTITHASTNYSPLPQLVVVVAAPSCLWDEAH